MSKYVCGIDIGTTGVKVMIFSLDGTVISSAYTEYACTFPQSGWVDQERILHKLGVDGYYQDWSNGSLYGLMNIKTFEWDLELIEALDIERNKLPELVPSGQALGKVSASAAFLTGFAEGTLLVAGAGDQQCAGIGAGAIKSGTIEVTMGTAGVTLGYMDQPNMDPTMKMPCSAHAIAGKWESEGLQNAAGAAFKWFRNEFAFEEQQKADAEGLDVYDVIDEEIEKVQPGCNGLIFLPYLASSAAPNWDAFARGTFIGFNLGHGKADMARAILASLGAGLYENVQDAVDQMLKRKKVYEPNLKNTVVYEKYFKAYKEAYQALSQAGIYEKLVKLALNS